MNSEAAFVALVNAELERELAPGSAEPARRRLVDAARHLALAGEAKRARPLLTATLARARGKDAASVVDAAVGIELVHTASLLHDDIVDGDVVRRGRPTVNAKEGNTTAVLTGDFVLSRALGRMKRAPALLARTVDVLESMTLAALAEVEARGDVGFTESAWRAMAAGKTGALFGLCGCAAAGDDVGRAERWFRAGVHLGVAFQIADDVADLEPGDDVRERNPSFPVVAAVARSERVRALLAEAWSAPAPSTDRVRAVVREVEKAGGVAVALDAARKETEHARRAFGDDASHEATAGVLAWADALVARAVKEAA